MRAPMPHRPQFYLIGDSLTQQGADPASSGWVALLQHKHVRSVDVINRGLSGYNTTWFVERALQLFAHELKTTFTPSLVTLWLGANDASLPTGCDAYQYVPLDVFRANVVLVLRTLAPLLPPRAKILLITPPAVIDDARRACSASGVDLDRSNDAAAAYARACVDIGQAENVSVLDLHTHLNAAFPDDAARGVLFSDGLHFSALGNAVVAQQIADKIVEMFGVDEAARFDAWQLPSWRDFRS